MSEVGYCKAYRKAWAHPAFKDLRESAIWNFLYQNAFYEDGERCFNEYTFQLKRGQIVVSISFLAKGFGMTEKGVRVVIQKLEKLGMLVKQGTSKGTIITICNYNKFQDLQKTKGEPEGKRGANEGQTKGENKNEGMKKGSNEVSIYDQNFLDIWEVWPRKRRGNKDKAYSAYKSALKRDTEENINNGIQAYIDSKEAKGDYAKGCAAWFNNEGWTNDYNKKGNSYETANSPAARFCAAQGFSDN